MRSATYEQRRGQLEAYFDRTAVEAWKRLTSDAPLRGIRATVRAGRTEMRETLLSWLPQDMRGERLLDAGCGTGALAIAAAQRGATVVAVDLSPTLLDHARASQGQRTGSGSISFHVGDMLDPSLGEFDRIVAMDSLIHYSRADVVGALCSLLPRCRAQLLFTFPPRTMLLTAMHTVGRLFPRGDRAPAIEPQSERALRADLGRIDGWRVGDTRRVAKGFYISQALELRR
jgi:magnesium-protoporphyrin O-methyltransferase